ncbi:xylitol oxidase [Paenibacillus cellulosilyticus]|uniref:Xylitol oxidase n=1 Tax=Paenibacillus cellulosilyticus TaxID=375489 RepID=A0A2V2YW31_9BACL|nr:FAD-binding protein [Paenibacillus cellulosilyticus]PWW02826.1 xylitol oxidase [Paenibacillus cellulosilyticus]QKS45746.1 FAD-binding protein [Paenibacillus cellulosilyticus]
MEQRLNWAGNYRYGSSELLEPASMEEVRDMVVSSQRIRVLGSRHSFNGIADTQGSQLSLRKLDRVIELDREQGTVTVEGGIRYGELGHYLNTEGFALHNLASLPHISVAGAVSTATHGSGDRNEGLASAVRSIELVKADGEVSVLRRGKDAEFEGAVVGLGGLGVVTKLQLDVVPAFQVSQTIYDQLPLTALAEGGFNEIMSAAYSVSLFTNWEGPAFNQVWVKRKWTGEDETASAQADSNFFGAASAPAKRHPVPGQSEVNCSEQLGVPGPWHERLPHFRMDFTPSAGNELQSEYFVPRKHAFEALRSIEGLREQIAPLLYVSEVRTIAADRFWMSPCYRQDSVGLHFTWKPEWESVRQLLPLIEQALAPFEARPHWAKLFTMEPDKVQSLYGQRLSDFRHLLLQYDPTGKFRNAFLDTYIFE